MITVIKVLHLFSVFLILNVKEVHSITPSNYKFKTSAISLTELPYKISGKWQVGRVSRKQYEIINMLYRKTKTFVEPDSISTTDSSKFSKHRKFFGKKHQHMTLVPQNPMQESFQIVRSRLNHRQMTPSYIEFYYLDDSDERIKGKDKEIPKSARAETQSDEYKFALLRSPFFLFRVNDATCKPKTLNFMTSFLSLNQFSPRNPTSSRHTQTNTKLEKANNMLKKTLKSKYVQDKYITRISIDETGSSHKANIPENKTFSTLLRDRFTPFDPTTPYDRIKFFEIYDSDTYKPHTLADNKMDMINDNYIQNEEKIYLDQVDHDTSNHDSHNITRFVKKHVNFNYKGHKKVNESKDILNQSNTAIPSKLTRKVSTNFSRPAKWSDFSFIAVYVYEPKQVRCDSASISPHWLVASATCLHRHQNNFKIEGRSAFVAYCGDNWRLPGRITYVKRSFIHPRYQTKEKSRRYLYNIGVIEVVNSMATTCNGWQPISLMSHQILAEHDGTFATAIGWGLDRFDTSYSSFDLPNYPLMLYEGLVYSDSCPGNAEYSKVKLLIEESVKNVYCLSLPPYTLEENDSVHGGLLLIGEKLIALYLQEERRPWGEQSAQYTGIWRLIPWLLDVAREVEEPDNFASEM